jgi:hypothetical protein
MTGVMQSTCAIVTQGSSNGPLFSVEKLVNMLSDTLKASRVWNGILAFLTFEPFEDNHMINFVNIFSGKKLYPWKIPLSKQVLQLRDGSIVTAGYTGGIRLWNCKGELQAVLTNERTDEITELSDGKLASVHHFGIRIWNIWTFDPIMEVVYERENFGKIISWNNGRYMATVMSHIENASTVRIVDAVSGSILHKTEIPLAVRDTSHFIQVGDHICFGLENQFYAINYLTGEHFASPKFMKSDEVSKRPYHIIFEQEGMLVCTGYSVTQVWNLDQKKLISSTFISPCLKPFIRAFPLDKHTYLLCSEHEAHVKDIWTGRIYRSSLKKDPEKSCLRIKALRKIII